SVRPADRQAAQQGGDNARVKGRSRSRGPTCRRSPGGLMPLSIIVFDDFYGDPMALRDAALKLNYPKPKVKQNWPGRNGGTPPLAPGLEEAVSKTVAEKGAGAKASAHSCFRLSLAGDATDRLFNVHIDEGMWWAGIVYLTLPDDCQGGTEFFRHKATL